MTLEELSDHTHNGMMNHALSSVAAIFEGDGWSPCDALKAANGLMEPAFRAWGELTERIIADDKRIRELETELAEAREDSERLDAVQRGSWTIHYRSMNSRWELLTDHAHPAHRKTYTGKTARAAIDAARKGE